MKKADFLPLIVFAFFLLAPGLKVLADQIDYPAAKSGNAFLDIGAGAKPVAMGEAYTALAGDATALYWNPAGLGQVDDLQVMLMHDQWFQNTLVEYGVAALPLFNGVVGLSATYVGYGSMDKTDENGQSQGTFTAYDMSLSAGFGMRLSEHFLGGVSLIVPMNTIDHTSQVSLAADLGVLYFVPGLEKLRVGFDLMNAGTISGDITQPSQAKLGFGLVDAIQGLNAGLDVSRGIFNNTWQTNVGAEYWIFGMIAPRAGYEFSASDSGLNGFTAGLGWKQRFGNLVLNVDYAYVPFSMGDTHRISLLLEFGPDTKPVNPAPMAHNVEKRPAPLNQTAVQDAATAPAPVQAAPKQLLPPAGLRVKKSGGKITLTWVKNETSSALAYNVYQRAGEKGHFWKLNTRPVAATAFQTGVLKPGRAYYFKITGVDTPGTESDPTEIVKLKK